MKYDIVDNAETAMKDVKNTLAQVRTSLTTSQIRKILTAINLLKNKVDIYKLQCTASNKLSSDLIMEVKFLKVNILYQVGREGNPVTKKNGYPPKPVPTPVRTFVEKAQLIEIIDDIGDNINEFYKFCKYIEALVAFHKYYGGKDR